MLKKLTALFLALSLLLAFALAGNADEIDAASADQENFLIPRTFMSMFDAQFKISADLMRETIGDEEADRLVEEFALTEYDADDEAFYYASKDWNIQITFPFTNPEDVSPDNEAFRWYLCMDDSAGTNAAYLTMYTLKMMIAYRYRDTLDERIVQNYFETFTLGEELHLPDGYDFIILRPDDEADYVVFAFEPAA
ncbi:MAG: hypothetical protein K6E17_01130 [Clostridiales bacterium]|nr:hypothetical protein [Clostridiales bacterium]